MGKLVGIREYRDKYNRAGKMPHRKPAGDDRLDARLECPLGRLFFRGEITQRLYEAGVRYRTIALDYHRSTDAPEPYGSDDLGPIDDAICFKRKALYKQAKMVLEEVSKFCSRVVDRIAVFEEEPRCELEIAALILGLQALNGDTPNLAGCKPQRFPTFGTRRLTA